MKVLYIVGVGRSGSTLLERMLGAVPGSVNAGELNAIFSRVATQDQRCGCGEPFSACPFWQEVGDRAFGGWSSVTKRMASLQPRVVRQRFVPHLATGLAGAQYRRELDEYLDAHHRLYRAISDVSGAEVVVDASKSTAQLFALRRIEGLDLRVINLVRDSRGVANSWSKSGIRKPQSQQGDEMGTYSAAPAGRPVGRPSSWSPPSSVPRRRTPPGSATKTSSTVPGPRSPPPCAASASPPGTAPSTTWASTASPSSPATGSPGAVPASLPAASSCSSTTPGTPVWPRAHVGS